MHFVPFNNSGLMGCWATVKGRFLSLCGHQWSAAGPSQGLLHLGTWPWGPLPSLSGTAPCSWLIPPWWHWTFKESPPSPSPPGGSSQLSCLQPLMCQVFKHLSIQSIHANLLNRQTLLKNKSTLSPPYWRASGWEHSTFTLEDTDGELQDVGYWGDGWDRYGSLQNRETGLAWDGAVGRRWRMTKSLGNPSLLYAVNLHSGK